VPSVAMPPPLSSVEPVTELFYGTSVTDPYRWLEQQDSAQTRAWLAAQTLYARTYLDGLAGRARIRKRIHELLAVETVDSLRKVGDRYFFRKRLPNQEQPCIYMRETVRGEDQLLVDPARRGTSRFTAIKPVQVSPSGQLLLYEVKEGGERTGIFEILDVETRRTLPDVLPRGYLRGFTFARDGGSFYYVHEPAGVKRPFYRAAYLHVLGTSFREDRVIFEVGESKELHLGMVAGSQQLGFLAYRFLDKTYTDFYLWTIGSTGAPQAILRDAEYSFGPRLLDGTILALTDRDAPNFRIVKVCASDKETEFVDVIPEGTSRIVSWAVTPTRLFVSYVDGTRTHIQSFDLSGAPDASLPGRGDQTIRLTGSAVEDDTIFLETESFTEPVHIRSYSVGTHTQTLWTKGDFPFAAANYSHTQAWFTAKDGTHIPMFLVGQRGALERGNQPTIMTSYGGFGVSSTPRFSVFVAFLMEQGCLFAVPNIRGGSEFGRKWHEAARRRNRQVAIEDFLCAAEWLIATGRTLPEKLAVFGGSNSGLLVAAAMTQRPELFRAVVCIAPMLDMLRYHLFDNAHVWKNEFGTADDPEDYAALVEYSPYHRVRGGVCYPATLIVSGDADQNCNPLHARKMTARLQATNTSARPILLDYSRHRGHSPVLPLSHRVEALTDRMAFLCDQLGIPV
jgi:prolyl oligopeptidase